MSQGIFDKDDTPAADPWPQDEMSDPSDPWAEKAVEPEQPVVQAPYSPPSTEESVRRNGLAYSIGIVFFVSIAFMLFLGWGADLLLGSKPWGLVAGVVLGAVIGFIQVFRITSQIFNNNSDKHTIKPLLSRHDEDQ